MKQIMQFYLPLVHACEPIAQWRCHKMKIEHSQIQPPSHPPAPYRHQTPSEALHPVVEERESNQLWPKLYNNYHMKISWPTHAQLLLRQLHRWEMFKSVWARSCNHRSIIYDAIMGWSSETNFEISHILSTQYQSFLDGSDVGYYQPEASTERVRRG